MAEPLTTLERMKARLGITDTSQDENLTILIQAASDAVAAFLGYDPTLLSYSEVRDGNGRDKMVTNYAPVKSVSSVQVNEQTYTEASDYKGPGYQYDDLAIFLMGGAAFQKGRRNVRLAYTAGYDPIPGDIQEAVEQTVHSMYSGQTIDPNMSGESVPGVYSASYREGGANVGAVPTASYRLLDHYVKKYAL